MWDASLKPRSLWIYCDYGCKNDPERGESTNSNFLGYNDSKTLDIMLSGRCNKAGATRIFVRDFKVNDLPHKFVIDKKRGKHC